MLDDKKIVLVYLPCVQEYTIPPVGISYLSSYLTQYGYNTELCDFNIELLWHLSQCKNLMFNNDVLPTLKSKQGYEFEVLNKYHIYIEHYVKKIETSLDEIQKYLHGDHPEFSCKFSRFVYDFMLEKAEQLVQYDVIGFSVIFPTQLSFATLLSQLIKSIKPSAIIVFGGPSVSLRQVRKYASAVFIGDGEQQLLDYLNTNSFSTDKVYISKQTLVEELDKLPAPDYEPLFKKYHYLTPEIVIPLAITRGCYWGKCKFCSYGWVSNVPGCSTAKYRKSSIDKIISEVKYFMDLLGSRLFYFTVDVADPKLLIDLSRRIIAEKLTIFWRVEIRAEKQFLEKDVLSLLYEAGCRTASFGLESVDQRVLDAMNKGVKVDVNKGIIDSLYQAGIGINTDFFIGFPSETSKEAALTQTFVMNNSHKIISHDAGGVFLLFAKSPIAKQNDSALLRYDSAINGWIKAGMSFETQNRQQEVAYVNMILNPQVARFPFRNDGVSFFVYCVNYSVNHMVSILRSEFLPGKIYKDIKSLFAFVFYYLELILKENLSVYFIKYIERSKNKYCAKSKQDLLRFYHDIVLLVVDSLTLDSPMCFFLKEVFRFNFSYLSALLCEVDDLPGIAQSDELLESAANLNFDPSDVIHLKLNQNSILCEQFKISVDTVMDFGEYEAVPKKESFVIFTIHKVLIFSNRLPLDIVHSLLKSKGKLEFSKVVAQLLDVYSANQIATYLNKLVENDIVSCEKHAGKSQAEEILKVLSQLEANELTLQEANDLL